MDKLLESPIAYSHHYYVIFLQLPSVTNLDRLAALFPNSRKKKFKIKSQFNFLHLQTEIAYRYGSPTVLENNKTKLEEKKQYYIYDFYLGSLPQSAQDCYFICYPYLKMGKYLERILKESSIRIQLQKPVLALILDYMKMNKGSVSYENGALKADIVQYGAEIVSDETVINISGKNPLQSAVYRKLEDVKELNIEPVRLKLQCYRPGIGDIQLSFDRLGNYRFWIGADNELTSLAVLSDAYRVFQEGNALVKESFINEYSMLENGRQE